MRKVKQQEVEGGDRVDSDQSDCDDPIFCWRTSHKVRVRLELGKLALPRGCLTGVFLEL